MALEIKLMEKSDSELYSQYVQGKEGATFYHCLEYRSLLSSVFGVEANDYYLIALEEGRVVGVLPLFIRHGAYGKIYNSLPFYGSHGGILADSKKAHDGLKNAYRSLISEIDVCSSTIVQNPFYKDSLVFGSLMDYRIGQYTILPNSRSAGDRLMSSFHSKTRNMIRKAQRQGIVVDIDNDAFDFLEYEHNLNMKRLGGIPKPNNFFNNIKKHFKPEKDYLIYVAQKDGVLCAALLIFFFRDFVEYYLPVIKEEYRSSQPLSLIIYCAMKDAARRGYKVWNWGGTWQTQHGVYRFKKRFGAVDIKYGYQITLKNKDVLRADKDFLLEEYKYFYVIPFHLLSMN